MDRSNRSAEIQPNQSGVSTEDVQRWLDRYVDAWRSGDPRAIAGLFTADAVYWFLPYGDHVHHGRDAIVESWIAGPDVPEVWEATYTCWAVSGYRAVATGTTLYLATSERAARLYHNVFLLEFAGAGRCRLFREYNMLESVAD
jgi:hypothetical protein